MDPNNDTTSALDEDYDNAVTDADDEDQDFDTLDDAMDALGDFDDLETDQDEDAEETPEGAEEATPEDEETADDEELSDEDKAEVQLDDGTNITLSELKKGYFRQKDYTAKTMELAEERKAIQSDRQVFDQSAQRLETAYANLAQTLEGLVPAEPPLSLAQSDPGRYQYQMALRQNAMAELQAIFNQADDVKQAASGLSDADFQRYQEVEKSKLLKAMPALADPGKMQAWKEANKKTAMDFGFTEQEIASTLDSRILQLVHFARIGKTAEHNRQNAKRRIAEKPKKADARAAVKTTPGSRDAMRKLQKSGSIEDAMGVDFE